MNHPIYKIVEFKIVGPYTLQLKFDDGINQIINFKAVLEGEIYAPLKDQKLFGQVEIDPEAHTLIWPNGADFDPQTLHDWPRYEGKMKEMAKCWAISRVRT